MPVVRAVTSWRQGEEGFLREIGEQVGDKRPAFVDRSCSSRPAPSTPTRRWPNTAAMYDAVRSWLALLPLTGAPHGPAQQIPLPGSL